METLGWEGMAPLSLDVLVGFLFGPKISFTHFSQDLISYFHQILEIQKYNTMVQALGYERGSWVRSCHVFSIPPSPPSSPSGGTLTCCCVFPRICLMNPHGFFLSPAILATSSVSCISWPLWTKPPLCFFNSQQLNYAMVSTCSHVFLSFPADFYHHNEDHCVCLWSELHS